MGKYKHASHKKKVLILWDKGLSSLSKKGWGFELEGKFHMVNQGGKYTQPYSSTISIVTADTSTVEHFLTLQEHLTEPKHTSVEAWCSTTIKAPLSHGWSLSKSCISHGMQRKGMLGIVLNIRNHRRESMGINTHLKIKQ